MAVYRLSGIYSSESEKAMSPQLIMRFGADLLDALSLARFHYCLLVLVSPALHHPSRLPRRLQHHGEGREVEERSCGKNTI